MTCKYCGAQISPEDLRCPHCHKKNTFAAVHNAGMKHYQKAYDETRQQVSKRTRQFQTGTMWILLAAALSFCFIVWMFWGAFREERLESIKQAQDQRNYEEIVQQIREKLAEGSYVELAQYSDQNDLRDDTGVFKVFYPVLNAANFYAWVSSDIEKYRSHSSTHIDYLDVICTDLDLFYDAIYLKRYEDIEGAVNDENKAALQEMKDNMAQMLQQELGFSADETASFGEMTDARREHIIREKMEQ